MFLAHVQYFYTGNMLLAGWIMYIGIPIYNLIVLDDGKDIEKKKEKSHFNNNWFLVPLWL